MSVSERCSRFGFPLLLLSACFVVLPASVEAGSAQFVGQKVTGRLGMDSIDHSSWDKLLQKYVDDDGYVDYRKFHASGTDRKALGDYLKSLSHANPKVKTSKQGKLAFWINSYNAVTVHGILQKYPTTSIRNHTAKVFGYNIWHDLQLYVGGTPYSLDTIEHKILRKMNEPRIHFAIVCASIGCPRLMNRAFTKANANEQLETNARDFFSRSQNFQHRGTRFQMSSIMDWFGTDFGNTPAKQLQTIAKWLPTESAKAAAIRGGVTIAFLDYNWQLNDRSRRTARRQAK